jgi:hypothetical protein
MENHHEYYFRNHFYGRLEKEEIEINRKIDRGIRTIFGTMVAFILLVFLNEIFTKTGPVKGVVLNAEFLEEGWVGPPSMFSNGPNFMSSFTYFRPDSYEILVSVDSGELVTVLCFECNATSYKPGDSIDIVRVDRFLGSPIYKEIRSAQ